MDPILNQHDQVHISKTHFSEIHFNIILHLRPIPWNGLLR